MITMKKLIGIIKRKKEWKEIEYFDEKWKTRIMEMAKYINISDKKICDIGCGQEWLRDYLQPEIEYCGVDYVERNNNTIICDLNRKELPSSDLLNDVVFCSGVLEYINDLNWFIKEITISAKKIIISYVTIEDQPNIKIRQALTWVNNLNLYEVIYPFINNNYALSGIKKVNLNTILCFERV